jgi:16S rRNA (uracil1498-N3)-methyltransferase
MARYDFHGPRLYVRAALWAGANLPLDRAQAHYLGAVMRLEPGSRVLVFNGSDGEWSATLNRSGRTAVLAVAEMTRAQTSPGDLHYLFAPLKAARLDYMVQKAVEMGVSRLRPVITRHTQVARVNVGRMRANTVEAAEQCGILSLPDVDPPVALGQSLAEWEPLRHLVFCDEDAEAGDPIATLASLPRSPLAVLIGPEGGFAEDERAALLKLPTVVRLPLGPRILRADTAAVAALALVQAVVGDWR